MAWTLLKTNYTDAVWSGLKRYVQSNNNDGTVSFQDVTEYTYKEDSFFGAKDANEINKAINHIMTMLENGTNLYQEFNDYFKNQQVAFQNESKKVVENVRALSNSEFDTFKVYLNNLKNTTNSNVTQMENEYKARIITFEGNQKSSFDTWFNMVKGQLSTDPAGKLQVQLDELRKFTNELERMMMTNSFETSIALNVYDELLVDELGNHIVANFKYKEV